MKSLYLKAIGEVALVERPLPTLQPQQVLVRLQAAAYNRRDQWIRDGMYPAIEPAILGSDGCGVVEAVGESANAYWIGKEVIINPNNNWGSNPLHQSDAYHILGMPTDGTFAEYIAVNEDRLAPKPAHLSAEEAAALPLAGLTAYRAAFMQGGISAESKVLISGVGGGVAQFAFLFAQSVGAEVWVTTGSDEKLAKMKDLGAAGGVNYRDENWLKTLQKSGRAFDVVIDSAGGETMASLIKILGRSGRLVFYGATLGLPPKIDLYRMFFNQIRLQGSTMGNDQEFADMVELVSQKKIVPLVDEILPFENVVEGLDKIATAFGKVVVRF
ncbi:zinc-binding dehydrogenase [Hugenholtzia roseola]|uniref:zinc-binding dehydrogenase n=1 Tax=Hugenholtzia roseola TaxID=1002 RepID=UPI000411BE3A|nr:zinc-binding dehydrogenase [Hugenholtzia roseola]